MNSNEDSDFKMSGQAAARISEEAGIADMPVRTWFRNKAYALSNDPAPTFDVSGLELRRTIFVGINDRIMTGILVLAEKLGIPESCVGELIACYNMPNAA